MRSLLHGEGAAANCLIGLRAHQPGAPGSSVACTAASCLSVREQANATAALSRNPRTGLRARQVWTNCFHVVPRPLTGAIRTGTFALTRAGFVIVGAKRRTLIVEEGAELS